MSTTDFDLTKGIVKRNAATFFEWRKQVTALLAGLSVNTSPTSVTGTVIKEGNRCHYIGFSTLS